VTKKEGDELKVEEKKEEPDQKSLVKD